MKLAVDIEADDLWPNVTKVHCLCAVDVDTDEEYEYRPGEIDMALGFLDEYATEVIFHNGIGYDLKVLKKLFGWEPKCKVVDTLVWSRLYNPDLNGHGLEAWGKRFKEHKGDYASEMREAGLDPWADFNEHMLDYCTQDCRITARVYNFMQERLIGSFSNRSVKLEETVAQIIEDQAEYGVYFDINKALELVAGINERREEIYNEVRPHLVMEMVKGNPFKTIFKINGEYNLYVQRWVDETGIDVHGPFCRVSWEEPDMGSRQKMAKQLIRLGWKPIRYTDKGSPQITYKGADGDIEPCPNLVKTLGELGHKIAEYYVLGHRRGQIQSFLDNVRPDHRISAGAISNGTNTGRMTHKVVANLPRVSTMMGEEMRSLFRATPGKVMVGVDLSGLELRCLAHYMGDPTYTDLILNGDIHTYNQELAGLPTRDNAKTLK